MGMDLDRAITINGHVFPAGKDVDTTVEEPDGDGGNTTVDYEEAITDVLKANQEGEEFASKHHGEVPSSADPLEETAQTPTRPLANQNSNDNSNKGKGARS